MTLLVVGLVAASMVYVYAVNGPYYRTTPVETALSFSSINTKTVKFNVDRSEEYLVELHVKELFERQEMEAIMGGLKAGGGGAIDVSWKVAGRDRLVGEGSNLQYGYSPIFGKDKWGLTIGSFFAERGKDYTLSVTVNKANPEWDKITPRVKVGLHPSKLEGYLAVQLLAVPVFIALAIALVVVLLIWLVRKSRMAS